MSDSTSKTDQLSDDPAVEVLDLTPLENLIAADMAVIDQLERQSGSLFTRVGMRLDIGAFSKSEAGEDWRLWARGIVPRSDSIIYKVRQGGAVSRELGYAADADVDTLPSYLTLVPFWAVLKTAKTDKERKTAADKVRRAWKTLTDDGKTMPTADQAQASADKIVGRIRAAQASTETTETETEDRNEPTENDSPSETVKIDPAAVEAARKVLVPFFKQFKTDLGVERDAAAVIMSATIRLVREHGHDLIEQAIS